MATLGIFHVLIELRTLQIRLGEFRHKGFLFCVGQIGELIVAKRLFVASHLVEYFDLSVIALK